MNLGATWKCGRFQAHAPIRYMYCASTFSTLCSLQEQSSQDNINLTETCDWTSYIFFYILAPLLGEKYFLYIAPTLTRRFCFSLAVKFGPQQRRSDRGFWRVRSATEDANFMASENAFSAAFLRYIIDHRTCMGILIQIYIGISVVSGHCPDNRGIGPVKSLSD